MENNEKMWKKLYYKSGLLKYEGFVVDNEPSGAGTMFYPNGKIYKEGVFGFKGLICGTEYYSNGNKRFTGLYHCNKGYGPNYPIYGTCYHEDGNIYYEGKITIKFHGSMWWPEVIGPTDYGEINLPYTPNLKFYDNH